ncbi:MAG: hypothetical protein IJJ23_02305 [Clostridia bacterium]|nr:hypothetical protein [Clostridia bacterium]
MASQGRYFRFVRHALRLWFRHYRCSYQEEIVHPVIYICRHRNTVGPISTLCCLPAGIRPWVFSVFTEIETCHKQLSEYTFPITWHIKPALSAFLARISSRPFVGLVNSSGAIPVYRSSLQIRQTFQKSIEALLNGDSLIIYPDVNYVEENAANGTLYDGFLMLEMMWNRKTGGHVRFVPVNISVTRRRMDVGKSISFPGVRPYNEEKKAVVHMLEASLDDLASKYGL